MRKFLTPASWPQFVRFSIVGAIGFCVDACALYAAIYLLDIGPYFGRVVSYFVAATATWYLNRTLTFPTSRGHKGKEWLKFVAFNCFGGIVNYSVYIAYLHFSPTTPAAPVLGLALGSCTGLIVNYTLSRHLVFARARGTAA